MMPLNMALIGNLVSVSSGLAGNCNAKLSVCVRVRTEETVFFYLITDRPIGSSIWRQAEYGSNNPTHATAGLLFIYCTAYNLITTKTTINYCVVAMVLDLRLYDARRGLLDADR